MSKNWGTQTPLQAARPRGSFRNSPFLCIALFCLVFWASIRYLIDQLSTPQWALNPTKPELQSRCPQVEPLHPARKTKELDDMESYLASTAFRDLAVERLGGAVRIPTESFDDMGDVGVDPRWDIFYSFADYLSKTYPLTHATLQLEKINTHGLLYTWAGTDPRLKPNLLMAHQDVVPVPESTVKRIMDASSVFGHFDGKFVWGRGASDCKNTLIGILSAVEALLSAGFNPKRTLILSFGFDEEISGPRGAKYLSEHLLKKLGHNSIAAIIDEGAPNTESWGSSFAVPGVTEKGYVDIDIVVRATGGHSSIPPKHNGIGIASELITLIEGNTYEPHLAEQNPYLELLHCGAEHAPHFPHYLGKLLDKRSSQHSTCKKPKKDKLALEAAKAGPQIKYLFTTSVAVDLIAGGTKNNALPERTKITVNHRINIGSSSSVVKDHIASLAARVAHKHNLTLHAFAGADAETPNSITLSHDATLLEPAPVTPTSLFSSSNSNSTGKYATPSPS